MTEIKLDIINDPGNGKVEVFSHLDASFDQGMEDAGKQGFGLLYCEDVARLRIKMGLNSEVARSDTWTREGILYVPKKGVFLTKSSPIMENAAEATRRSSKGREYHLTEEQVEKALTNSIEIGYTPLAVPVNELGNHQASHFLFGKTSQEYGEFLSQKVKAIHFNVIPEDEVIAPFVRQLCLCGVDRDSAVSSNDRLLSFANRMYVVKEING